MQVAEDPTALRAEANAFRYRPLGQVAVWRGAGVDQQELTCARAAAAAVGVRVEVVDGASVVDRAPDVDKVRLLGSVEDAARLAVLDAGCWVDDIPVAAEPGREVLRWVREQAVSETLHRHGNISDRRPGLPRRLGSHDGS
jgi:RHH-type proline utilization regulon transcriptional repressor/proline dehydrogenase/delta 1-pyrroline-5-carboxylate dehydrogenase